MKLTSGNSLGGKLTQNRSAPAYLEYATDILASIPFRTMTLKELGLWWTIRLESWPHELPSDYEKLAKVLRYKLEEIEKELDVVMPLFKVVDGVIVCQEHEDYKAYLAEKKSRQSHGGKLGSAITNAKRKTSVKKTVSKVKSNSPSNSPSNSQVPRRGSNDSSIELNRDELNRVDLSKDASNNLVSNNKPSEYISSAFATFWKIYPKHIAQSAANKAWNKAKPPVNAVLKALAWQTKTKQWIDGYAPNPTNYIDQKRWEDEPDGYRTPKAKFDPLAYINKDRKEINCNERVERVVHGERID